MRVLWGARLAPWPGVSDSEPKGLTAIIRPHGLEVDNSISARRLRRRIALSSAVRPSEHQTEAKARSLPWHADATFLSNNPLLDLGRSIR